MKDTAARHLASQDCRGLDAGNNLLLSPYLQVTFVPLHVKPGNWPGTFACMFHMEWLAGDQKAAGLEGGDFLFPRFDSSVTEPTAYIVCTATYRTRRIGVCEFSLPMDGLKRVILAGYRPASVCLPLWPPNLLGKQYHRRLGGRAMLELVIWNRLLLLWESHS